MAGDAPSIEPVTAINGDGDLWISPAAVRQRIGAWAYDRALEAERPTAGQVRKALGVADAIAEVAHAVWRAPDEIALSELDVPAVDDDLAERAGLSVRDGDAAVELLVCAGVLTRTATRHDAVRIAREVLTPSPALARLAWRHARERLHAVGASVPAALGVLREIARESGPVPDAARAPSVRYSVRELEAATQFGRSTVSEALAALERAQLIVLDARRGQTMRCALTPTAFGQEVPASAAAPAAPAVQTLGSLATPTRCDIDSTPAAPATSAAPTLIGEFAGTPIYAPPGTPLVVECDAEGRWSCRVGPLLRMGPVAPKRAD